jgi:hypothetical protein
LKLWQDCCGNWNRGPRRVAPTVWLDRVYLETSRIRQRLKAALMRPGWRNLPMADEIYLRAPYEKRRPPPGVAAVIHLDEPGRDGYPLHHNLARLPAAPGVPGQSVAAFLLAALGVWAADKFLPRGAAPDAWTRQITLHLPVSADWLPLADRMSRLLNFLTGDDWTLKLRQASLDLGLKGAWPHDWRPDGVMLFSGGLDSLVGAIDSLEAEERLLLVSHYDFHHFY